MADKAENELVDGMPARLRGLDAEGNSINTYTDNLKKEMYKSKSIQSGSFDDIIEPGEYTIYSTVVNAPYYSFFWLKVIGVTDVVQIAISFNDLKESKRSYVNNIWSDWK